MAKRIGSADIAHQQPVALDEPKRLSARIINRIGLIGLLGLSVLRGVAAPPVSFLSARNALVGSNPIYIITGDFNLDGKLDVAVSNSGSSTISILLGAGNGAFNSRIDTSVANAPQALAKGDFNSDGRLDLAVVNAGANSVSILLGNGDGTFRPPINAIVPTPSALAVADFNRDGKLDLAVGSANSSNIQILLGDGKGIFSSAGSFAVGFNPIAIAVGDFNADGRMDIAVANGAASFVSILIGNGTGTFRPAVNIYVGGSLVGIVAADFNKDGRLDLGVLASSGAGSPLIVLLGNGNATFQDPALFPVGGPPVLLPATLVGTTPQALMTVADLNNDGVPDVAVTLANSNRVSILIGLGNGFFEPNVTLSTGAAPSGVVVGDFNGDAKPDLAVANSQSNSVSILINLSTGNTSSGNTSPGNISTGSRPIFTQKSVVNGASFVSGPLAPGEIVAVFGSGLGPGELTLASSNESGGLPSILAGTRLLIAGAAAPLLYVSSAVIAAIVPYEISGRASVNLQIESTTGVSDVISMPSTDTAPALFSSDSSGVGQGSALNEDGGPNGASNPSVRGSVVTFFGTGMGQTNPAGITGSITGSVPPVPLRTVSVSIGGIPAEVVNASGVPGDVAGVFEVQARIPPGVASGNIPVVLTVGNSASSSIITVQVE